MLVGRDANVKVYSGCARPLYAPRGTRHRPIQSGTTHAMTAQDLPTPAPGRKHCWQAVSAMRLAGLNPLQLLPGAQTPPGRAQASKGRSYSILLTRNTGYPDAIFPNSARGASLLTGICGRAPGAIRKYSFRIGARFETSTFSRSICSVTP